MLCLFAQQATRVTAFNQEKIEQHVMIKDEEFAAMPCCIMVPVAIFWMAYSLIEWRNMIENFVSLFGYNLTPIEPVNKWSSSEMEVAYHEFTDIFKKKQIEYERRQEIEREFYFSGTVNYAKIQKDLEKDFIPIMRLYKKLRPKFSSEQYTREFGTFAQSATEKLGQTMSHFDVSIEFVCTVAEKTYKVMCQITPVNLDIIKIENSNQKEYFDKKLIEIKYNGKNFQTTVKPFQRIISKIK